MKAWLSVFMAASERTDLRSTNDPMVFALIAFVQIRNHEHLQNLFADPTTLTTRLGNRVSGGQKQGFRMLQSSQ
jgi:hypothetical protein